MPTNTYTPLATVTLGSGVSSVSFGSIGSGYRDLVVVFNGDASSGVDIAIRLNNDSGSNYNRIFMIGNGSTTASGTTSGANRMDTMSGANGRQLTMIANIMDSPATDKHKTVLTRDNDTGFQAGARAFRWANTAAVTSVQVLLSSGSFISGSTISLYGVIA
jgi:hypothetical protein